MQNETIITIAENYRGENIMHKQTGRKYFFIEKVKSYCNTIEGARRLIDSRLNPPKSFGTGKNRIRKENKRKLKNQVAEALMEMKNGY